MLLSLGLRWRQRYIKNRHQTVLSQLESLSRGRETTDPPTTHGPEWEATESEQTVEATEAVETKEAAAQAAAQQRAVARQRRLKFWYEVRQRCLQLGQLGLWGGGLTLCLSLFPQTRWIQSILLAGLSITLLQSLLTIAIAYLTIRISFISIDHIVTALSQDQLLPANRSARAIQRLQTFSGVVKGTSAFVLISVSGLVMLSIMGVNTTPLLAGVSILGVALSFGAQSLVKDMINGLFVLLEDQYGIGDVITANGETGLVEVMNLRITQLRSLDGDLITLPNGTITLVKNHTSNWSRVNLAIDVAYHTDLDRAIAVIGQVATQMSQDWAWRDVILEAPQVLGVDKFGENSITIRLWVQTLPLKQWEVGRELRRRLKYAFDAEGISIPFPQRSLWLENSLQADRLGAPAECEPS